MKITAKTTMLITVKKIDILAIMKTKNAQIAKHAHQTTQNASATAVATVVIVKN